MKRQKKRLKYLVPGPSARKNLCTPLGYLLRSCPGHNRRWYRIY